MESITANYDKAVLRKRITQMYNLGLKRAEIIVELDIHPGTYDYHIAKLRHEGKLLVRDRVVQGANSVHKRLSRHGLRAGTMANVMENTTLSFNHWVIDTMKHNEYDSLAELCRELLLDAFEEERANAK